MAFASSYYKQMKSSVMASSPGRAFTQGVGETLGFHYKGGVNMGFMGRKMGISGVGSFLGRAAFPAFTAFSAYQGYKQGGVLGAVKNVASDSVTWGVMRAGFASITNPYVIGAGALIGAGYGVYRLGEAARKSERRVKNLELGTDIVDRFGTVSTMRQRSLQAIQNTHMNARGAIGNEALLLSTPYLR